jgi:hypothetical protein
VQAGAVGDVRLEARADQGQVVALRELFAVGPGAVHEKNRLELPVRLKGETARRLVEVVDLHALVDAQADRDAGVALAVAPEARVREAG